MRGEKINVGKKKVRNTIKVKKERKSKLKNRNGMNERCEQKGSKGS